MISAGRLRKLKKGLPAGPEPAKDEKMASRKDAKTLSLSKMQDEKFFFAGFAALREEIIAFIKP